MDATAVRWAAAVAFGVVLALCVLPVLLLMSSAAVPRTGMPLGFALGIAAVAGLLGGGGFGWALSRWGWVPHDPVPPRTPVPAPAPMHPAALQVNGIAPHRPKYGAWVGGVLIGLLATPSMFFMYAIPRIDVLGLAGSVLLSVLLGAICGVFFGLGLGFGRRGPVSPVVTTAPTYAQQEALRAIRRERRTGDPQLDLPAWHLACHQARNRNHMSGLFYLPNLYIMLLPSLASRSVELVPFLPVMASVLLAMVTLGGAWTFAWGIRQRNQARRFLALFEEAGIRG
ncbi:hypothetical protein [Nocardiopsis protaetiae]|uniref:hypothetical protein n=1 Tax=Nocardiopsis protaetiae TaxID=3382270 RepID=UPI00387B417F